MKQVRRIIGLLLAVAMLTSMVPVAFADATSKYPDFPTGWSKQAMTAAVNNGLLNGYEDGKIHPEANLTRAQFAAIMVRAFGAKTKANISGFKDVPVSAWYYEDIAKAVKMGALNGQSATQMAPDSPITRQEVFTAFARILVLSDDDTTALNKFNDKGEIASWASNHMAALTQRGYVNGDPEGNVNPSALISREEFAQLMHNAIRTYITEPGTYTDDLEGITVIRVGDVTLKGLTNTSDLVIGDGVGEGKIIIENVNIGKRLLVRGGGVIKVVKSTLGDYVVVNNVNGVTKFENYRSEAFFKGIVENTKAQFSKYGSGGSVIIPSGAVYTLTLMVDGEVYDVVTVRNGVPDKVVTPPTKDYYTFDGWFDGTDTEVTDFGTVTATQSLNAKFTPISYNVTFTSDPAVSWNDAYTPITDFTVEELSTKELPPPEKVAAPLGYVFDYWMIDGTRVDSLAAIKDGGYLPTATTTNLTITAHLSLKEYRIEYAGVTFIEGYTPVSVYNIVNAGTITLPTGNTIANVPAGKEFKYWKNVLTNTAVYNLSVTSETPDVITLEPHFEPILTEPVTVTFYRIYSDSPMFKIGDLSIEKGTKVDAGAFPDKAPYIRTGYVEDANVASIYDGNEYTHEIVPEFWYVKDGVMTPFDETVEVNEDTSVYLLSKSLSLMLQIEGKLDAQISADYNSDTRLMNTVKDLLAKSARQQLEFALTYNMIPNYDEMVGKAVDKMVAAGVIELDGNKKNIQVVDVPFKISMLIEDNQDDFVNSLMREDTFEINESNVAAIEIIKNLIEEELRKVSLEDESTNVVLNTLIDAIGIDAFREDYNKMIEDYFKGLEKIIEDVKEDRVDAMPYTTALTYKLNIFDIYEKVYDKAKDKVEEKLQNAGLYYGEGDNDNEYLTFLVDHNIVDYLFNYDSLLAEVDGFTGYSLKDEMDYYDYLMMLLIVGDDALTWYGDKANLSDDQFNALYDAMFDKIFIGHEKVNEILTAFKEDGELPDKIQGAVESIDKLNSLILQYSEKAKALIGKYLDSDINIKFEDGSIEGDERIIKLVDVLVGKDDPVVNIDSIYALLHTYGDAYEGIDVFKVPAEELEVTDIDIYKIKVGKITITVQRSYR